MVCFKTVMKAPSSESKARRKRGEADERSKQVNERERVNLDHVAERKKKETTRPPREPNSQCG